MTTRTCNIKNFKKCYIYHTKSDKSTSLITLFVKYKNILIKIKKAMFYKVINAILRDKLKKKH